MLRKLVDQSVIASITEVSEKMNDMISHLRNDHRPS
jgi:hypothetical protein